MHVPDGFIDAPVSIAAGVVAAGGIAVCLRGARRELDDRTAPMAGLVAAFVFAVQMLNFPVAAGTSGHLLGGALAAILVGPYTGALCVAVVLLVQGLLFADGGLTAIGVNVLTMSLVTVVVGWAGLPAADPDAAADQGRRSPARRSSPRSSPSRSPRWRSSGCTRSAAPPTCRSRRWPRRWSACTS